MIKPVIIYGPTATGKTALGIDIASKTNGIIISADSRQVYKRLDIGNGKTNFTAKVKKFEGYWIVDGIKILGFDLVDPQTQFSVADFLKFASKSQVQIRKKNKVPIIVGGTAFYIKALISGIGSVGVPPNINLRKKLGKLNKVELLEMLKKTDPQKIAKMNESDRNNPRRLIRAIEISKSKTNHKPSKVLMNNFVLIGLTAPNQFLYKKADDWLKERLENGLENEINNLIESGISVNWLEGLGLEYRWITKYLTGKFNKEIALKRLSGDIHSFIRRQKTWFSKFPSAKLFDITQNNWQKEVEKTISLCYTRIDDRA